MHTHHTRKARAHTHTHSHSLIHISRKETIRFLRLRALVLCACLDVLHGEGGAGAAHACTRTGGPLWLRMRGGGSCEGSLLSQRLVGDELREQAEERARRSELRKKRAERKARRRRRILEVGIRCRRRASVPPCCEFARRPTPSPRYWPASARMALRCS